MARRERTSWRWEFGVRRADGKMLVSAQREYPWNQNQARQVAEQQDLAAERLGMSWLKARVVKRKRWTTVIEWADGWERD